jgi:RHS repeat-associated protein
MTGDYIDTAYAPFGYAYAQSGSPALSFTGQKQDTAANLYDFMYREYGIQGRWPSPDPLDTGAFNLADPQTLDLYAYVRNSPMMLTDPLGLDPSSCTVTMPDGSTTRGLCTTVPANGSGGTSVWQMLQWGGLYDTGPYPMIYRPGSLHMGGGGGAGGFGGGNTAGTPQTPGRVTQVAQCAANLANTMSVAHYAHLRNVPVASNIFSNDFSSLTNLFFGPGRTGAAVGLAENLGSGPALSLTGKGTGAVTVDSGFQFLFSSVPATTFGETAIGGVLTKSLSVAADWLSGEAEAQAIYDAGIYTGAVYVCAEQ